MLKINSSRVNHSGAKIILEQLEERIVLDGAIDDVSHRADLSSSQASDDHGDSENHVSEALAAEILIADALVFESGTEWLPDGTWHYWEQDWDASGNGYRFDAWEDGTQSFHQIHWDAAANSKGTHNGFDYNLQRDGSWTYQAVQWDASQNGYTYNSTSAGVFSYYAQQWSNGLGYDYSLDNAGKWTYHTVSAGNNEGERSYYMADSTGWWDFTYTWPNGVLWHATADDYDWHAVNDTWAYRRAKDYIIKPGDVWEWQDTGQWKLIADTVARFEYNYATEEWRTGPPDGNFSTNSYYVLGTGLSPAFIGDGAYHVVNADWYYQYVASTDTGFWKDTEANEAWLSYDYGNEEWYDQGNVGGWSLLGSIDSYAISEIYCFVADGNPHKLTGSITYSFDGAKGHWDYGTLSQVAYDYGSGQWWVQDNNSVWETLGGSGESAAYPLEHKVADPTPQWMTVWNGALYFSGDDAVHGRELWKWDGTQATMIADIYAGSGNSSPAWLTEYNGSLYFSAATADWDGHRQLWRYDGTQVTQVSDIAYASGNANPKMLTVFQGALYFSAIGENQVEGSNEEGYVLYKYDGTQMTQFPTPGSYWSDALNGPVQQVDWLNDLGNSGLVAHDGKLYFGASWGWTFAHGDVLCRFDGSGSYEVAAFINPIDELFDFSYVQWITEYNEDLYFSAYYQDLGTQLWKYDGTGVTMITDFGLPSATPLQASNGALPSCLTVYDGDLYFIATDTSGNQIWKYDGDALSKVTPWSYASGLGSLKVIDDHLYFWIDGMYRYDAENGGIAHITPDWTSLGLPPQGYNSPGSIQVYNGEIYYEGWYNTRPGLGLIKLM